MTQHEQEQSKQGRGTEGTVDRNATRRQGSLPSGAAFLVGLQRSAGNRAVAKMMSPSVAVQRELKEEEKEALFKEFEERMKAASEDNASSGEPAKTKASKADSTPPAPPMATIDELKAALSKANYKELTKDEESYINSQSSDSDVLAAVYESRAAQVADEKKAKKAKQGLELKVQQLPPADKAEYQKLIKNGLSPDAAMKALQDKATKGKKDAEAAGALQVEVSELKKDELGYYNDMVKAGVSKDDAIKAIKAFEKRSPDDQKEAISLMGSGAVLSDVMQDMDKSVSDDREKKKADALALAKLDKWPRDRKEQVMKMIASGTSPADAFKAWDEYYKKSVFGKDNQFGQQYGAQYSNMMSKW